MAKRRAHRRTKKEKEMIAKLEAAAAAVLVMLTICISVFGGNGFIPTWGQINAALGITDVSPAPTPAPTVAPGAALEGSGAGDGGTAEENAAAEPETQVHFIDVGQGDAVLIERGGEYALIDCGTEDCETTLLNYLDNLGVTTLKILVMTHPHADHIGSMDAVIRHVKVELLLMPQLDKAKEYPTTRCFEHVLDAVEETDTPVQEAQDGDTFAVGGGTLTVLGTGVKTNNYNDISVCTRFTAGGFAFVDTGDGEKDVEQSLLDSDVTLSATLFKAAHHASRTANTLPFLQAVKPQLVVVSCGEGNSYGHPHAEALENYAAVNAEVYRTDTLGNVVVTYTDAAGLNVYTEKQAKAAA